MMTSIMSSTMRRAFGVATLLASSVWGQDNSVSQTNAIQAPKILVSSFENFSNVRD